MIENYNQYQKRKFNMKIYTELDKDLLKKANNHFGINETKYIESYISMITDNYESYIKNLFELSDTKYKITCLYRKWYNENEYQDWIKFEKSIKTLITNIQTKNIIFNEFNNDILNLQKYYKLMYNSKNIRSRKRNKEIYLIWCMLFIEHCIDYFEYDDYTRNNVLKLFKPLYHFFK